MQTLIRTTFTTVCAAAALGAVLLGAGTAAAGTPGSGTHTAAHPAQTVLTVTGGPDGGLAGSAPNGNIWGP